MSTCRVAPFALLVCVVAASAGTAWAHKPIVVNGGPTTAATAYQVTDVNVSQVAYHKATATQPELWLTFQAAANTRLYLQLGAPKLDSGVVVHPAMALLGPGLPAVDVPFDLPPGYGGYVFDTGGETPVLFHEEFTGTDSWQFATQEPVVPADGKYYVVGYLPGEAEGKFWLAIGTAEQFGLSDILSLPRVLFDVRAFHEVGPVGGLLFWAMAVAALLFAALLALIAP